MLACAKLPRGSSVAPGRFMHRPVQALRDLGCVALAAVLPEFVIRAMGPSRFRHPTVLSRRRNRYHWGNRRDDQW